MTFGVNAAIIICGLAIVYHGNEVCGAKSKTDRRLSLEKRNTEDPVLCDCVEYSFYHDRKTWDDAQQDCENNGGTLAIVNDQQTHDSIKQYISDNGFTSMVQGRGYWIGLMYLESSDTYKWVNDDVLIRGCDFEPWAPNEPNKKVKNGVTQNRVQMWKMRSFNWDDDFAYKTKSYICMNYVCPADQNCSACVQ
ncbi:C-type lectin lectoxin-Thr1-like [Ptychodera flava]|uniref:C-type lectin lectoxin-Thr1-like n=1 Tax=Ptychodera flava TaxID=63121 RepID=UPI00396A8719